MLLQLGGAQFAQAGKRNSSFGSSSSSSSGARGNFSSIGGVGCAASKGGCCAVCGVEVTWRAVLAVGGAISRGAASTGSTNGKLTGLAGVEQAGWSCKLGAVWPGVAAAVVTADLGAAAVATAAADTAAIFRYLASLADIFTAAAV
jgi:hypothetical protein